MIRRTLIPTIYYLLAAGAVGMVLDFFERQDGHKAANNPRWSGTRTLPIPALLSRLAKPLCSPISQPEVDLASWNVWR
mgnify:CR=1 FL=1